MILKDIQLCDLYCPDMIISIRNIPDDFKWYSWAKYNNLRGMTYAFCYKNHVIKFGCSFAKHYTRAETNKSYAERIVRQIKNLPGRLGKSGDIYKDGYGFIPKSKHGQEIVDTIIDLEKKLNVKIDKNDIYIHIWNITDKHSSTYFWADDDFGNKKRAEYFEGLLVHQYKQDNNGNLPIGNKQDPSTHNGAYVKPKITKEAGKLFTM
jgi:hypothetical protein